MADFTQRPVSQKFRKDHMNQDNNQPSTTPPQGLPANRPEGRPPARRPSKKILGIVAGGIIALAIIVGALALGDNRDSSSDLAASRPRTEDYVELRLCRADGRVKPADYLER
ncbi:hypothetical protein B7Z00_03815 [Candidatus Saccharibacteria bacterium 32-50-10]|nr:MAG: hypothetical protein B7Z00_03815 [Candidatus Saccharibacteria bacterium 32-50-10]